MAWNTFVAGNKAKASEVNENFDNSRAELGEVKMFALSMAGAVTKATLQGKGWAICDGTTPATQGISSPTIATTPNLQHKFIRMSDDESSSGTGGEDAHNHRWLYDPAGGATYDGQTYLADGTTEQDARGGKVVPGASGDFYVKVQNGGDYYTKDIDTKPPYYELAYFMKVKL